MSGSSSRVSLCSGAHLTSLAQAVELLLLLLLLLLRQHLGNLVHLCWMQSQAVKYCVGISPAKVLTLLSPGFAARPLFGLLSPLPPPLSFDLLGRIHCMRPCGHQKCGVSNICWVILRAQCARQHGAREAVHSRRTGPAPRSMETNPSCLSLRVSDPSVCDL